MDQIASLFEDRLLEETPRLTQLQYRADDLLGFIDSHKEFVALVFDRITSNYVPHDHTWIKERLIAHLTTKQRQSQAPRSSHQPSHSNRGQRRY
ncbi:hypothetical protein [Absidia glauca]|uniref:Uncharacterized protein n=1 Tax=Absidia glauca TaxID=4829 RepID=A0A163J7F7_ABSGL|nr:hypothetical protein [Absidia glauca]